MKIFTFLTLIALLTQPALALAETNAAETEKSRLSLGVAMMAAPEFEGAKKYQFLAVPIIEYEHDLFFVSTFKGAGIKLINTPSFQMGPAVSYRFGRDQDDSDELKGMGDVDGGFEAGLFARWQVCDPIALKLNFKHGLGSAKGFTVDLEADYTSQLTESLTMVLGAGTRFADRDYNQEYFGVTHQQSRMSGYQEYNPDSGLKHVAAKVLFSYELTDSLNLGAFGEYKRLTGSAADSPLVKNGSADQVTSGLTLIWTY